MRASLLSNRVVAIAFVVLVSAIVLGLVGTDENEGALATATQSLAEKAQRASRNDSGAGARATAATPAPAPAAPAPLPAETTFVEDEMLIDDAAGFDPTPVIEDPSAGEVVGVVPQGDPAAPPAP